jgi:AraC-like DNA-binding protein
MGSVVILAVGERERAEAERAVADIAGVRFCDRADDLLSLATPDAVRVVVSELRDRTGRPVAPTLEMLGRRQPAPAVLLYIPPTNAASRGALAIVASGVHVRIVFRGIDRLGDIVRDALAHSADPHVETTILERIAPHVPRSLAVFFALCAAKGSPQLTVARAAEWVRTPPRTLQDRLRRARLPAASRIVGWCCALHAVWRLDVLDQSVKQVVAQMGFPSRGALSNLLTRYCRCTPTTVHDHGGFSAMLDRFVESLHADERDREPEPVS